MARAYEEIGTCGNLYPIFHPANEEPQPDVVGPRSHSFTPYPRSLNPRFHPPFVGARPKSNNAISERLRRELSQPLFAFLPPTDSRASSHHYLWGLRARHTACPPHVWGHMHRGSHGQQQRLEEGKSRWCKEAGFAVDTRSHDMIVPLTHLQEAATERWWATCRVLRRAYMYTVSTRKERPI